MPINKKIIYLISGHPKQGKSTIAKKFGCTVISLDSLFFQYYEKMTNMTAVENVSVFDTLRFFSQKNMDEYSLWIFHSIDYFIKSEATECVIDGWLLDFYKNSIKDKYSDIIFLDIRVFHYDCYVDGVKFFNKEEPEIEQNIVNPIKEYLRNKILKSSNPNYHYFDTLKIGNEAQKSKEKYEALNLNDIVSGKSILDIGCNTGYNSIKMACFASDVVGLDCNREALQTASTINNLFFQRSNLIFAHENIFNFDGGFQVILASSIMHYFTNRQQEFIDKCYNLLIDDGVLVLECGIAEQSKVMERADGLLCEYPSKDFLVNELCKNFKLIYEGKSVDQIGDEIPRYVFHFKK